MFPYEINYDGNFFDNGWGNIFMILMVASLGAYFILFNLDFNSTFFLPVKIIGIIAILIIPLEIIVPLKFLKIHIGVVVAQFFSTMSLSASIAITALRTYQTYDMSALPIVILILATVMTITILWLAFNPKLSLRIMYDKTINEKGEEVVSRPKAIVLAFTEWILIFSVFVDAILMFILMLSF